MVLWATGFRSKKEPGCSGVSLKLRLGSNKRPICSLRPVSARDARLATFVHRHKRLSHPRRATPVTLSAVPCSAATRAPSRVTRWLRNSSALGVGQGLGARGEADDPLVALRAPVSSESGDRRRKTINALSRAAVSVTAVSVTAVSVTVYYFFQDAAPEAPEPAAWRLKK